MRQPSSRGRSRLPALIAIAVVAAGAWALRSGLAPVSVSTEPPTPPVILPAADNTAEPRQGLRAAAKAIGDLNLSTASALEQLYIKPAAIDPERSEDLLTSTWNEGLAAADESIARVTELGSFGAEKLSTDVAEVVFSLYWFGLLCSDGMRSIVSYHAGTLGGTQSFESKFLGSPNSKRVDTIIRLACSDLLARLPPDYRKPGDPLAAAIDMALVSLGSDTLPRAEARALPGRVMALARVALPRFASKSELSRVHYHGVQTMLGCLSRVGLSAETMALLTAALREYPDDTGARKPRPLEALMRFELAFSLGDLQYRNSDIDLQQRRKMGEELKFKTHVKELLLRSWPCNPKSVPRKSSPELQEAASLQGEVRGALARIELHIVGVQSKLKQTLPMDEFRAFTAPGN